MADGRITQIALAIVRRRARWLVGRRAADDPLGGLWEFPGGKVTAGETVAQAAVRECAEETSVRVEAITTLEPVEFDYGHCAVCLHPVLCRYIGGVAHSRDCAMTDVRWVDNATLASLDMPGANRSIVAFLVGQPRMVDSAFGAP